MLCDNCGSAEAVTHVTTIKDNQMSVDHLCEKCAAAKGLESMEAPSAFPLTDFLAQMGGEEVPEGQAELGRCGFCGLTFSDFRETGRLGCPHCWATFEVHLRGLLRRIHGGTSHVGKVYLPPDPTATEREKRLEALRRRLQRAVDAEDFERAASIRDQIRALEPTP
jgi:protein arginine kinase activator